MKKLFEKGQSGNPGGRPKAAYDVKALAQANTAEAFEVILKIMRDEENPDLALKAANIVIERGYGKPIQEVSGMNMQQVVIMSEIKKDNQPLRYSIGDPDPSEIIGCPEEAPPAD